jgi:hypothetical protein
MASLRERPRTVAICENCTRPVAARLLDDGPFLPIGGKRCACGGPAITVERGPMSVPLSLLVAFWFVVLALYLGFFFGISLTRPGRTETIR